MTSNRRLGFDPSERKFAVDQKLELETENLAWLKSKIKESEELKDGMVRILTSFEQRLGKLEETILPVYQETENLQRRQENIDATLAAMDHVIGFYNVSKEVESVIRDEGPAVNLESFLHDMSRLKGALNYFEQNNPRSIELENVKSLYTTGGNALSREFSELIKKHSKPISPSALLNAVKFDEELEADENFQHFPEDIQSSLIQMAEWLSLNEHDEFMHIYATVRGSVTKKSLDQLREHRKSTNTTDPKGGISPNLARKFGSPMGDVISSPNSKKVSARLTSTINRRFSSVSSKLEAAAVNIPRSLIGTPTPGIGGIGGLTLSSPGSHAGDFEDMDVEVGAFTLFVNALQKLMASEQLLMTGIIPQQYKRKIFEIIIRDSMDLVVKEGDLIMARVKKCVANNDFLSIITLFQVIRHLMNLKPSMDRTMETCDASVRSKYNAMINQMFITGSTALDDFIEGIRSASTTKEKMPKDGTVFQLTSNVLLFLEQLQDFVDTLATVITTQDSTYNQSLVRLQRKISVRERNLALGIYFNGIDITKVPCYRNSLLYSIMAGLGTGVTYNLATSKSPFKIFTATFVCVIFPYWYHCRSHYREKLNHRILYDAALSGELAKKDDGVELWTAENIKKQEN